MPVPPSASAAATAAAAAKVLGPSRRDVFNLYRSLLRIHAAVLPAEQRALGDRYVREEFKAHKEVSPAQADAFMKTWQEYWVHLARSRGGPIGRDLDEETTRALSDEQVAKLDELAAATRSATQGEADNEANVPHDGFTGRSAGGMASGESGWGISARVGGGPSLLGGRGDSGVGGVSKSLRGRGSRSGHGRTVDVGSGGDSSGGGGGGGGDRCTSGSSGSRVDGGTAGRSPALSDGERRTLIDTAVAVTGARLAAAVMDAVTTAGVAAHGAPRGLTGVAMVVLVVVGGLIVVAALVASVTIGGGYLVYRFSH